MNITQSLCHREKNLEVASITNALSASYLIAKIETYIILRYLKRMTVYLASITSYQCSFLYSLVHIIIIVSKHMLLFYCRGMWSMRVYLAHKYAQYLFVFVSDYIRAYFILYWKTWFNTFIKRSGHSMQDACCIEMCADWHGRRDATPRF